MKRGHETILPWGLTESSMEESEGPLDVRNDEFDDWESLAHGHLDAMPDLQDGAELDPSLNSWIPIEPSSVQHEGMEPFFDCDNSFNGSLGHELLSDGLSGLFSVNERSEVITGLASGLAVSNQSSSSTFDAASYNGDIVVDAAWT